MRVRVFAFVFEAVIQSVVHDLPGLNEVEDVVNVERSFRNVFDVLVDPRSFHQLVYCDPHVRVYHQHFFYQLFGFFAYILEVVIREREIGEF